jgi:histidinol-phosphate/aromatic aminotransferase/cobyric acid decarboxylase-like protein
VGYGAFPRDMMEFLWRAKQPYNVSVAAEVAAVAALTNMPYLDQVSGERGAAVAPGTCGGLRWLRHHE